MAVALGRRTRRPYVELVAEVYRAEIELNRCFPRAEELSRQAIDLAERHGWTDDLFTGFAAALEAFWAAEQLAGLHPLARPPCSWLVHALAQLGRTDDAEFTAKVRDHPRGRILAVDFTPKKVIFGVMPKGGVPLTADTLFPFAQVTLAHTATELQARHQVTVEVIGIDADAP